MIAVNDSFWLITSAYILLNAEFRHHPCYIELIELFHLVYVVCVCVFTYLCMCYIYVHVICMLNKNTPGVKKSEAKSEAPESYSYKRLKSVISGGGQGPSCLLATM